MRIAVGRWICSTRMDLVVAGRRPCGLEFASLRSWRFATRLDRQGAATPVGPLQHCRESGCVQASWRSGRRLCLLKGCGQVFTPIHPFSRYCSSRCRAAARLWHQRRANRRYRASERGKCRRRAQSCRYRQRVRDRHRRDTTPCAGGEGYPNLDSSAIFWCRRPGCYERFAKTARSPLQTFCSAGCRLALRRVLIRERRWRRTLRGATGRGWRGDDSW